jgi:hypothetical protein
VYLSESIAGQSRVVADQRFGLSQWLTIKIN